MADGYSIKVDGLAELDAKLKLLPEEIAKKLFRKALRESGRVIQKEVQSRAPVKVEDSGAKSNSLPPGALKADIKTRVSVSPEKGGGSVSIGPGKKTAHVARWVENGHNIVGHKPNKKKSGKKTKARPFMRPALDASAQKAVETFAKVLGDAISELEQKS
jgi:HK97 gp10 family phage protein